MNLKVRTYDKYGISEKIGGFNIKKIASVFTREEPLFFPEDQEMFLMGVDEDILDGLTKKPPSETDLDCLSEVNFALGHYGYEAWKDGISDAGNIIIGVKHCVYSTIERV